RMGDAARGRLAFAKANCVKCHKFGSEGEGVGPDLTTLSKRFKRADTLESIIYPSKVISDQYRSTLIETKRGQRFTGLAATQGDVVTVLLNDATKVNLRRDEIESQFASLVSVMPEKLLDELSMSEIADLFAFLEVDATNLPALPVAKTTKEIKAAADGLPGDAKTPREKIASPRVVK
ncbi:MAG: c-type cytochrome, partial [Gemmataceae bacterium]